MPFLERAIESVLGQTHQPDQIVLVDAGSTDGSAALMSTYATEHPTLVETLSCARDDPIPAMRNAAIDAAEGDLITFLDGDDWFEPEKLERELATYERHPDARVVFSDVTYVDEGGQPTKRWCAGTEPPTGEVLYETLTRRWPKEMLPRNELVSAAAYEAVDGYDEALEIYEDWELNIRLSAREEFAYSPHPAAAYRRHAGGISSRVDPEAYQDAIERISHKHDSLIRERFDDGKQRTITQRLDGMIHRQRSFQAFDRGSRATGLLEYARYLAADRHAWRRYKQHLRVLLPEGIFDWLRNAHHRLSQRSYDE